MFKKNNWKMPIYKDDLLGVLFNGLLSSVLSGILAGLLDFLFGEILNFPLTIGLILMCYMIGYRMKRGYYTYHILYPVLSILFMIIALFFSQFSYYVCIFGLNAFALLGQGSFYLNFILNPIYYLYICFKSFSFMYLLLGILNIIIHIYAFVICYKIVKGRI